jgi:hypothetical protein
MAQVPERLAISPMTLVCPRCHAAAGQVCKVVAGELVVHVERIAATAAKDVAARHRLAKSR